MRTGNESLPLVRNLLVVLLTVVAGHRIAAAQSPFADGLKPLADKARSAWNAPGLGIAVIHGNQSWSAGLGVRSTRDNAPVTDRTLFPIGSCTKAFTSAVMASLVAEGKLHWDDPPSKYDPAIHLSDRRADALLTIRDLLSHRTGLDGNDLLWYRAPWSLDETIRRMNELPLSGTFRGSFFYSSIPVMAAGRLAGKAAGTSWHDLVRSRIARPLGMADLAFTSDELKSFDQHAVGYGRTDTGAIAERPAYVHREPNPAGSIHTSPRDLLRWLSLYLKEGTIDGTVVIPAKQLAETCTPHTIVPFTPEIRVLHPHGTYVHYGMGWLIYDYRGERIVAHGGKIDGFRSQITLLPDRGIGIALTNNLHDSKLNLALTLTMIDHLLGFPETDWNRYFLTLEARERDALKTSRELARMSRRADLAATHPLTAYVGDYADPAYGVIRIRIKDQKLVWSWSSFESPLEHWEGDSFRFTEGDFKDLVAPFQVGKDGVRGFRFADRVFVKKPN